MKTMLKKIVALVAIACMLISSVSVNAATKNYSQTALSRTAITREPGAQGFVALRNVNGKVKWTSSNTSVVSLVYQTPLYTERPYTGKISEVNFYCKKAGTSKITALYNGKKYICTITVKKGAAVPKFSKNSVTIKRGQSVALKVTGMDSESSYARYSSSNKGIATVDRGTSYDIRDNMVYVKGVKKGTTYVNCVVDRTYKLKCRVTVK